MNMKFSHLHCHSQFSLLDGAASINDMFKKAAEDGMPALAITDHGNMFGVFDFVKKAHSLKDENGKLKVKPIVGCEFYITENRHKQSFTKAEKDPRHHQILLAKNDVGYRNLIKLTSLGFTEGMYSKYPRIDKELINKHHEGLIATTCCLAALVPQAILKHGEEEAENEFKWWLNIFQDDYYIELQRHGIPEQEKVNEVLLKFAKKYKVKVIASNDSHYVDQKDANTHDILLCLNTGAKQSTPINTDFNDEEGNRNKRFAFYNDQFYLKSTAEMLDTFKDLPEAIDNTNEIVDKVEILDLKRDIMLPHFKIPANFKTQDDYLESITWAGAKERYRILTPEVEERISFELGVIRSMGFAGYFLIVSDFIKAGRDMGVFIGPGRGSAAGSAVAYCIGITNIDPIKYNLLFERFLNPDRKSMPDIDTDFDDVDRQKVIDYVVDKYGRNQVAQIVTYGTMAAKSSIADVARVLDLPLPESRVLTKLVPDGAGVNLKRIMNAPIYASDAKDKKEESLVEKEQLSPEQIDDVKQLREIIQGDDQRAMVLKEALKLEGSIRNTGVHAAGIIIAPEDLMNLIPVATSKDSHLYLTQIEGKNIEDAGVIKMDFLGLKNLSIMKTAIKLIKLNHGIDINLDTLPLDDEKTFDLYKRGDTVSTFQFESAGMQKHLKELKPDRLEDLIAMNALFRPGPMAYIHSFIKRKHGTEAIVYDLPEMEEFLEETYGITVYQEQVMQLSQKLANFTKGDADVLRKAMGKKDEKTLDKMYDKFIKGTKENGHPDNIANKIWTDWKSFAHYAFNKSHSTCYAYLAYHTAYLKANYSSEYMAAVLTHAGSIDKITLNMQECKKMGITVLGPDINESLSSFSVNKKGQIRFGLGGLKGVGEAAIESILEERTKHGPFKNIYDFVKRVNLRSVNKKSIESLVYSGALDNFSDLHRAQYFFSVGHEGTNLERLLKFGQSCQVQKQTNVNTLFGSMDLPDPTPPKMLNCEHWTLIEKLDHEKDVTGMYMSGHPLDNFSFELKHYRMMPLDEFNNESQLKVPRSKPLRVSGLVIDSRHAQTKKGKNYGKLTLEDFSGKADFFLWGEDYARYSHYVENGMNLTIEGVFRQQFNRETYEFKVNKIILLETLKDTITREIVINVDYRYVNGEMVNFLTSNIESNPGDTPLKFKLYDERECYLVALAGIKSKFRINDDFIEFANNNPLMTLHVQC